MAVDWQSSVGTEPRVRRAGAGAGGAVWFLLASLCVIAFMGPVIIRDTTSGIGPLTNEHLRLLVFPLTLLCLWFMLVRWRAVTPTLLNASPYLALIAYATISYLWSVDPPTTLNRSIALILLMICALGLNLRFSRQALAAVVGLALLAGTVVSLVLWVSGDPMAELWGVPGVRGAFSHKNVFGQVCAIGLVLGLGLLWMRGMRVLAISLLVACGIGVVAAQSATGLVAAAVGLGVLVLLSVLGSPRVPMFLKLSALAAGAIAALAVMLSFETVLDALGRDATMTGRTEIWAFTLEHAADRPLLGHGHRAFWTAPQNEGLIEAAFYSQYDQSHNGYLQILLDLGAIGLLLFLVWTVQVLYLGLRRLQDPSIRVWLAVFVLIQVYAFGEGILLQPTGFAWMFMSIGGLAMCAYGQDRQVKERSS